MSAITKQLPETQIAVELEEYDRDLSWILDNYASLIKDYGNQFVAVVDRHVLASGLTVEELNDKLGRLDSRHAVIEFIYTEHPNFVLAHACHL